MFASHRFVVFVALLSLVGCGTELADIGDASANELGQLNDALTAGVPAGGTLRTTVARNLRSGPSTSASILRVMPKGANVTAVTGIPSGPWFKVVYGGTTGWAHGGSLTLVSTPAPAPSDGSCE